MRELCEASQICIYHKSSLQSLNSCKSFRIPIADGGVGSNQSCSTNEHISFSIICSTYLNSGEGRCLLGTGDISTKLLQSDLELNGIPAQIRTRSFSHNICRVVQTVSSLTCFSGRCYVTNEGYFGPTRS